MGIWIWSFLVLSSEYWPGILASQTKCQYPPTMLFWLAIVATGQVSRAELTPVKYSAVSKSSYKHSTEGCQEAMRKHCVSRPWNGVAAVHE